MSSNKKENIIKSFWLSNFALKNRTSVFLLTFLLAFGGIFAYVSIPKESFPEIVIPTIYIGTTYPGNSPSDMENLITRPIEKELQGINGVKDITSTSLQDFSSIVVEFNPNVDISRALQDVKDAVDQSKRDLPTDLDNDPTVREINFSDFPIMSINLSGDYTNSQLKQFAEFLEERIEALPQISKVDITGALEKEMSIIADLHRMEAVKVTFDDIENAVAAENVALSAGDVVKDGLRRSMRITAEFKSPEEVENLIIKRDNDDFVYLRDVAKVIDGYEERKSYARSENNPVVSLQVVKRSGENIITAAMSINQIIEDSKFNRSLPRDLNVSITNDQSKNTEQQVSNLENSIISGVILVTLTLLFFMGFRNALFVGIAIPMSMFIAFLILGLADITLNLMVLFSLILALGLLVDNGIVVVENIYRLMQEGYSPYEAAKQGVGEVALPIIASTATTLAAFFPLLFWQDMIGEFMKYLPLTLIIVLASSLFVALVINPALTADLMKLDEADLGIKVKTKHKRNAIWSVVFIVLAVLAYIAGWNLLGGLILVGVIFTILNIYAFKPSSQWFKNQFLPRLENAYEQLLAFAVKGKRPYYFFGSTVLIFFFSILLTIVKPPAVLFFPENEPNTIYVYTEMPIGTDVEYTDSITKIVEYRIDTVLAPYRHIVESVITNVGEGANDPNEGFTGDNATPNKSRVSIGFVEFEERADYNTNDIMNKVRRALADIPGATITLGKNSSGPPTGQPINIEISGNDFEIIIERAMAFRREIEASNIPGIEELKLDIETNNPEMIVEIDRERAKRFGLSTMTIGNNLRTALFGKEISKIKEAEDDYDIRLRLDDHYRYNVNQLLNQKITFRDQVSGQVNQVPISAVADVKYGRSYGSVNRKNLNRVVTIYSNVEEGYNATAINNRLKAMSSSFDLPQGYQLSFTGEQEEQEDSFAFLLTAMVVAVFTIFLILVSQFNSIYKPFIIVGSVIFSTIGVLLGLIAFNMDFVVIMTGIGIISLAGIVVNNAIVLIDYTDLVRDRMKKEQGLGEHEHLSAEDFTKAVVEGGKVRLRPVLLTAITTVLGLLPLATGLNINFYGLLTRFNPEIYIGGDNALFWGPMAWTVIFGLVFATFLTLVIVPSMYVIVDQFSAWTRSIAKKMS